MTKLSDQGRYHFYEDGNFTIIIIKKEDTYKCFLQYKEHDCKFMFGLYEKDIEAVEEVVRANIDCQEVYYLEDLVENLETKLLPFD